jgi:excisionase family DNA binding protein
LDEEDALEQLYTLDEVARILRVHRLTARRYITTGLLPAAKMGRAWRVRGADLEAFINSRMSVQVEAAPPPGEPR